MAPQPVDEQAVKSIAASDYFALGEDRIRRIAAACESVDGAADLQNQGRWLNPSIRKEVLRVLGADLQGISETKAWMVVRRYREQKRFFKEQVELAAKKKLEDEAKAKLAAEKAAKAAAAKAAKPATEAPAAPAAAAAAAAAVPAPATPPPPAKES